MLKQGGLATSIPWQHKTLCIDEIIVAVTRP